MNKEYKIERRELFDELLILLSNCLPISYPKNLIVKDVLDFIVSFKKICQNYVNEIENIQTKN